MSEPRIDQFAEALLDGYGQDGRVTATEGDIMDVRDDRGLNEAKELIRRAFETDGITQAELSRRTGIKSSAICSALGEKWLGRIGTRYTIASRLVRTINAIRLERQAAETKIGGFVRNGFARKVFAAAHAAIKRKSMVVIVAPAGSGKTLSLLALADEFPGAVYASIRNASSAPKPFLDLLAVQIGVDLGGRAGDLQDRIIGRLINSGRILLIDEGHKLNYRSLDTLREIYDATECPILIAATPSFRATLTSRRCGTATRELLDQIYSRVALFVDLSAAASDGGDRTRLHTIEDIRRVFARGRVRLSRDAIEFLARISNAFAAGGLRRCRHLVQLLADVYPDRELTAAMLQSALGQSIGLDEAGFVRGLAASEPAEREPVAAAG